MEDPLLMVTRNMLGELFGGDRVQGGMKGGRGGGAGRRVGDGVCGEGGDISVGEGSGTSKSKDVQSTSSGSSRIKRLADRVRVQGACRVWGTMKVTTPTSLKHAISKFCPASSLTIKQKTISDRSGQVNRWWFVVHALEDVLTVLDTAWEQIHLQTG